MSDKTINSTHYVPQFEYCANPITAPKEFGWIDWRHTCLTLVDAERQFTKMTEAHAALPSKHRTGRHRIIRREKEIKEYILGGVVEQET